MHGYVLFLVLLYLYTSPLATFSCIFNSCIAQSKYIPLNGQAIHDAQCVHERINITHSTLSLSRSLALSLICGCTIGIVYLGFLQKEDLEEHPQPCARRILLSVR